MESSTREQERPSPLRDGHARSRNGPPDSIGIWLSQTEPTALSCSLSGTNLGDSRRVRSCMLLAVRVPWGFVLRITLGSDGQV